MSEVAETGEGLSTGPGRRDQLGRSSALRSAVVRTGRSGLLYVRRATAPLRALPDFVIVSAREGRDHVGLCLPECPPARAARAFQGGTLLRPALRTRGAVVPLDLPAAGSADPRPGDHGRGQSLLPVPSAGRRARRARCTGYPGHRAAARSRGAALVALPARGRRWSPGLGLPRGRARRAGTGSRGPRTPCARGDRPSWPRRIGATPTSPETDAHPSSLPAGSPSSRVNRSSCCAPRTCFSSLPEVWSELQEFLGLPQAVHRDFRSTQRPASGRAPGRSPGRAEGPV